MTSSTGGDFDADSLFGSPPPSPPRGRSPTLALPTAPGFTHENVGTIALPGSHNCSELPVTLPASPPRLRATHQPFARPSIWSPSLPGPSRMPSPQRKAKSRKASKAAFTASRLQPPPLLIPEAGGHVPPGFLRNQAGLLGVAGIVGGVRPAKMEDLTKHGSSAEDPIIVEDPLLNTPSIAKQTRLPRPDLKELPAPRPEDVITALINQKNIFPVLKSILLLLSGQVGHSAGSVLSNGFVAASQPTGFERRGPQPPPLKRRKMKKVPAGAVDWDVPYPFPDSAGPSDYRMSWEKERGKQLMKQLIGLLKDAVHKAAMKSYSRNQPKSGKQGVEVSSQTSSALGDQPSEMLRDGLTNSLPSPSVSSYSSLHASESTVLNQFLASLYHSQQDMSASSQTHPLDERSHRQSCDDLQTEIQNWLTDIHAQHRDDDIQCLSMVDSSATASNSPTLTSSTRLSTPFDVDFDSNKENFTPYDNHSPMVDMSASHLIVDAASDCVISTAPYCYDRSNIPPDSLIDPVLLAISGPYAVPTIYPPSVHPLPKDGESDISNCMNAQVDFGNPTANAGSDLSLNISADFETQSLSLENSDFSSFDFNTPQDLPSISTDPSDLHDACLPLDELSHTDDIQMSPSHAKLMSPLDHDPAAITPSVYPERPASSKSLCTSSIARNATRLEIDSPESSSGSSVSVHNHLAESSSASSTLQLCVPSPTSDISPSLISYPSNAASEQAITTSKAGALFVASHRDTVLQRVKARREQLRAELGRAKVELWETSIEQAVLVHLLKDKTL